MAIQRFSRVLGGYFEPLDDRAEVLGTDAITRIAPVPPPSGRDFGPGPRAVWRPLARFVLGTDVQRVPGVSIARDPVTTAPIIALRAATDPVDRLRFLTFDGESTFEDRSVRVDEVYADVSPLPPEMPRWVVDRFLDDPVLVVDPNQRRNHGLMAYATIATARAVASVGGATVSRLGRVPVVAVIDPNDARPRTVVTIAGDELAAGQGAADLDALIDWTDGSLWVVWRDPGPLNGVFVRGGQILANGRIAWMPIRRVGPAAGTDNAIPGTVGPPRLAVDSSGGADRRLVVAFGNMPTTASDTDCDPLARPTDVTQTWSVSVSRNNGVNWDDPTRVTTDIGVVTRVMDPSLGCQRPFNPARPAVLIEAVSQRVLIAVTGNAGTGTARITSSRVLVYRSTGPLGTGRWVAVTAVTAPREWYFFPELAQDGTGILALTFYGTSRGGTRVEFQAITSVDGGRTFDGGPTYTAGAAFEPRNRTDNFGYTVATRTGLATVPGRFPLLTPGYTREGTFLAVWSETPGERPVSTSVTPPDKPPVRTELVVSTLYVSL